MAQIRETIELLCRILHNNGTEEIKAETFRIAKYNQTEATKSFWYLLYEILYFCRFGVIDDVSVKALDELSIAEIVAFVKKELQARGFYSRDFANLPADMSHGSRDLLLAFGWLLCKDQVIERFMENSAAPVLHSDADDKDDNSEEMAALADMRNMEPHQKIQYLLWLNGKLRTSLRSLYLIQRRRLNIEHKINKASYGLNLTPEKNHLSSLELYLLNNPQLLKKNLKLLDSDNSRLQDLLRWSEEEEIFWQWMEDVLDAKLEESALMAGGTEDAEAAEEELLQSSLSDLNYLLVSLHDSVTKYESITEHLERLCLEKSSEVTEEELDDLMASVNNQLQFHSKKAANLMINTVNRLTLSPTGDGVNFSLERPDSQVSTKGSTSVGASVTNDGGGDEDGGAAGGIYDQLRDIKSEINMLQGISDRMEKDLNSKVGRYQDILHNLLAEKSPDSVLIKPFK